MAFGTLQIAVLILTVLIVIKFLVLAIKPKAWLKLAKNLYSKPLILGIVELVLAAVLFYYLLQSLSIVQIMAAITLGALLTGLSFVVFGKELLPLVSKIMRNRSILWGPRTWFIWLIWLALVAWTLWALFA